MKNNGKERDVRSLASHLNISEMVYWKECKFFIVTTEDLMTVSCYQEIMRNKTEPEL